METYFDYLRAMAPELGSRIVEVKLEKGKAVVRGLTTTLPKLRSMGGAGWRALCPGPAFFIMGKEKGKLGYFWKHAFNVARSGRDLGGLINPDTGHAIPSQEGGDASRAGQSYSDPWPSAGLSYQSRLPV